MNINNLVKGNRCFRCAGAGFVYRVGAGYSQANMGGKKVTCPLCAGKRVLPNKQEMAAVVDKVDKVDKEVVINIDANSEKPAAKKRGRPKKIVSE